MASCDRPGMASPRLAVASGLVPRFGCLAQLLKLIAVSGRRVLAERAIEARASPRPRMELKR
jgi:hypothetical protein